ncbi:glycosyltransferase family 4 protein [Winogradskyella sp. Asnod2-B02-A]|uniref:glycosyltransferase family 4 protein n=1 Tax=Winogradskyella sp. Asnod2-B02-A TaxID=3160583 RepID=UPI00386433B4
MIIGLVLSNTPNYSETFFINKIKGLQNDGNTVILFVNEKRGNFSLCKVNTMPRVYKSVFLMLFQYVFVIVTLLPHFKSVWRFIKLEKSSGSSNKKLLKLLFINSHILKARLDWLHFGFASQTIGSELVAKAIGAKMAVSFRGFDINEFPKKHKDCYLKLWKNVDKVHSISQYLVDEAYKLGLDKRIPVVIISPAVDMRFINAIKDKTKPKPKEGMLICTVARLNWIKDFTTAIKTISLLKLKYPQISYSIIGGGSLKEKEQYLHLVEELGLQDQVVFYDKLSHAETILKMKECDLYLQTSLNEGFCNAVLEAQALGRLCVATNVGGLKENIEDTKTGWLVEPQNPIAISEKIIEIVNLSKLELDNIKAEAVKRVETKFNTEIQMKSFVEFYKNS